MAENSGWNYLQTMFSRKLVLWASFVGLLWLLRDFFPLLLFTFVISYLASSIVDWLIQYIRNRRLAVSLVYLAFIGIITALCLIIFPRVAREVGTLIEGVNQGKVVQRSTEAFESFLQALSQYVDTDPIEQMVRDSVPWATRTVLNTVTDVFPKLLAPVLYFLLSILLSFFLVLDLPNITEKINDLNRTRLRDYFRDVYPGVIAFFSLLGRALEAQTVIALVNTFLSATGLFLLGVPNIAMLSVIVFIASYIPVLGMWMSMVPIVIVALTKGGLSLSIQCLFLVMIIHSLEAYYINPRIYGAHMKVHSLMVLIILIVGEHLVGLWGLVLGVPIWTYIYRYVIQGQADEYWTELVGEEGARPGSEMGSAEAQPASAS